jgi:membrane protein implicated in regulation of membrane protease activity
VDDPESWRWIWLAVAVAGLAGEILTAGTFFLLPFGIGAAAACVAAFAGAELGLQWLLFVLVTAAATAVVRPIAKRLDASTTTEGIGARRWIGQSALVLTDIPAGVDETGLVRVGREEWRAQSDTGIPVAAGERVTVIDVTGTRLVVKAAFQGEPT